ncbi:hypothetical protein KIK06_01405 [Nocardiopsis sp. EMB25]|uniref:hypothetical protein n=1 Tax=Nocardiopsis sp. EMB25 TaxID=2835867 RepID=UPI002284A9FA|nr:hypothetical protein [Nocardiopsis sp. EMB25]MCY9782544.1 hypothetical protein [Nocardiopsis sp. EMB25]
MVQIAGDCKGDDCPKVFTTDRNSIVVQGDLVTSLDSPDGEAVVEIPRKVWEEAARAFGR